MKREDTIKNIEGNEMKPGLKVFYPNKMDWDEKFWKNDYIVTVSSMGIPFAVNADCEQDAIDYIIDYCEDQDLRGLVDDYESLKSDGFDDDEIEEFIQGGNSGLYLTVHNIYIEKLKN